MDYRGKARQRHVPSLNFVTRFWLLHGLAEMVPKNANKLVHAVANVAAREMEGLGLRHHHAVRPWDFHSARSSDA